MMIDHSLDLLLQDFQLVGVLRPQRGPGVAAAAPAFRPFGAEFGEERLALFGDDVGERLQVFRAPIRVAGRRGERLGCMAKRGLGRWQKGGWEDGIGTKMATDRGKMKMVEERDRYSD